MRKIPQLFFGAFLVVLTVKGQAQATLLKDINPGSAASNPSGFTQLGDNILFMASDDANGRELWITDGTEAGTSLLKDIYPGTANSNIPLLYKIGETVYFYASTLSGGGLWKTDGTAIGTVLVKSGFTSVTRFTEVNGTIFFEADINNNNFDELWKTDGTTAGTVQVKQMRPNSFYNSYTSNLIASPVSGELLFTADNGTGMALWKSDGTTAGTFTLKYLYNTPQYLVRPLVELNGEVFFGAFNQSGVESLWKTNGTPVGTVVFKSPYRLPATSGIKNIDNKLYFGGYEQYSDGYGEELWTSDGTLSGTYMIRDINDGSDNGSPYNFLKFQGNIYFSASTVNEGREFWKTDGTFAGTELVYDFYPGGSSSYPLTYTNTGLDKIYIVANNGNDIMLYQSDGTSLGTSSVLDLSETNNVVQFSITNLNEILIFSAETSAYGTELWKLDTSTLSSANFDKQEMAVYPNPVSTELNIKLSSSKNYLCQVINQLGQTVFVCESDALETKLDVSTLANGLYILVINSKDGKMYKQKLVKK
ncbi:MAG: T9SS type A sorting domain-containing protein [Flavobacteriaceae bacterium]|nr:T9SS type A sorting domain-containing protein [Aequorivita sp.]MCB0466203.1 T9SS type A sorting domain-containing protein [Aequorivita sp.]MCB0470368.1 T9SS type A sorting domain-containing protein [Flavobacteriaceae bacterium]